MISPEVKAKVRAILDESAKKYGTDGIIVATYEPKVLTLILDSFIDVATRAREIISQDDFNSKKDALDFNGLVFECLMNSSELTVKALSILLRVEASKSKLEN